MSIRKYSNFFELLYKKKSVWFSHWWIRCRFLFFQQFLGRLCGPNRAIWLSKALSGEKYSIKDFNFQPSIECQSYKFSELHLTRFFLEKMKLIKNSFEKISKTLFFPYTIPKIVKTPQKSSIFVHLLKDFQKKNLKSCMIRFGKRFPEISTYPLKSQRI